MREFAGCLNQDLLDFFGFSGWQVSAVAGVVGRVFASVVREFTRVYEGLRALAVCLNQDLLDFFGFSGWRVFAAAGVVGRVFASVVREFTRVHESLRAFAGCLNQGLLDFFGFSGWRVSAAAGVVGRVFASVVREFTRVHESLRASSVCAIRVGSSRAMSVGFLFGSLAGALSASGGPYRGSAPGSGILQMEFAEGRLTATTWLNFGQTGVDEQWGAAVVVSATRA